MSHSTPLADRLIRKLQQKPGRQMQDLSLFFRSRAVTGELGPGCPCSQMMTQLNEAYEHLLSVPELGPLFDRLEQAMDEFSPSQPPTSAVTTAFFHAWAFLDLAQGQETLGTICLALGRALGMHPQRLQCLEGMCATRPGLYLNEGKQKERVLLKSLEDSVVRPVSVANGHLGSKGELWLVRILGGETILAAPYVLRSPALKEWQRYLERHPRPGVHFKEGLSWDYWLRFIYEAYSGHSSSAITLTGLPDVPESRPLAPQFNR